MKTEDAIKQFGGVAGLARVLKVSPQAIYQWGEKVPRGRQYELQALSNGALRVADGRAQHGERAAA